MGGVVMCEVGMRVRVDGAQDGAGQRMPAANGKAGVVVGHLGMKWAIVALDEGITVLVPEGKARPIRGAAVARAVVVKPDGSASPLSRRDTDRVHVRRAK
jgi:hypothetical protein